MKMFYKIFISCIFLWIGNICHAQKGLAIAPLFSGKYDKDEQAIVVLLKGKTLHPYGLSLFHSISITDRPDDVTLFEAAVSTDSRKAENSETVKSGNNTIAGYYQLPPAVPDGENRFILFRKTSPHDATLIYLEGQTHKSIYQQETIKKHEYEKSYLTPTRHLFNHAVILDRT